MNNQLLLLLVFILLSLELPRLFKQKWLLRLLTGKPKSKSNPKPLVYKPKSEKDCPCCQAALAQGKHLSSDKCTHTPPIPWVQRKGKGGKKKSISTQGYFCPNPSCIYFGASDETIHALVGYGCRGKHEAIQNLRCQACKTKFTSRKHTPLYRLKTQSKIVCIILHLLALGVDASALEEVFGIRESTIRTWLSRSGGHGRKLHDRFFIALELFHIQFDELWANVKHAQQEIWVWTICDAKTKLIPVLQLGPRNQTMAYAMVHELKARLKAGIIPVSSSDGLKHYYYALTAHFGEWIPVDGQKKPVWMLLPDFMYGQVIKYRHRLRIVDIEQRLIWGLPDDYRSRLKDAGLSGNINTAFVERANLTIRQCVSKLTRRTWGTAHYSSELGEHLFWWLAYYHFARYHESLRTELAQPIPQKGKQRLIQYRRSTPAVAAGLTRRRWSIMELISYPLL